VSEQRDANALRVARANLEYGGMSVTGDATRLGKTLDAPRAWDPDITLAQEMMACASLSRVRPAEPHTAGRSDLRQCD
jgi:hypothetical protein